MARVTICIDVEAQADACEAIVGWFRANWSVLTYASGNYGCQCCVDLWDVEGPDAALSSLPPGVMSGSAGWGSGENLRSKYAEFPAGLFEE